MTSFVAMDGKHLNDFCMVKAGHICFEMHKLAGGVREGTQDYLTLPINIPRGQKRESCTSELQMVFQGFLELYCHGLL